MILKPVIRALTVCGVLIAMGIAPRSAEGERHTTRQAKVPLDLYVMSYCPFGVGAENSIFPSVKSLQPLVDLNLYFIANEQPSPDGDPAKVNFTSLHGQLEVEEDLRQVCVMKHVPKQSMDYILERNKNIRDPNWQNAAKQAGINPSVIEQCATGAEGKKLLSENLKGAHTRHATASPTIDIAGKPYSGPRGLRSITLAVCDALKANGTAPPAACKKAEAMPPDPVTTGNCNPAGAPGNRPTNVAGSCGAATLGGTGCGAAAGAGAGLPSVVPSSLAVNVQVIVDKTCAMCQPTFIDRLKQWYPAAKFTLIDINSQDAKALLARFQPTMLPLYLLEKQVDQAPNFKSIRSYFIAVGDSYVIPPSASAPTVRLTRTRLPRHLDLFVRTSSPATVRVEADLMRLFRDTSAKDLTFSIHFLVQEGVKEGSPPPQSASGGIRHAAAMEIRSTTPGPLVSAGGEEELQESLRQVCLFQHVSLGDFFKYLACRNEDLQNPKRTNDCLVMGQTLSACLTGSEGEMLLRKDAQLASELGMTAGPVILWENRYGPFRFEELGSLESLIAE